MMWIALAIVFCAVLFLVDKNKAWKKFWIAAGVIVLGCASFIGYHFWAQQRDMRSAERTAKRAKLHQTVKWYVDTFGSCPGTEAPDWKLDNPCPNSVIPDGSNCPDPHDLTNPSCPDAGNDLFTAPQK